MSTVGNFDASTQHTEMYLYTCMTANTYICYIYAIYNNYLHYNDSQNHSTWYI